MTLTSFARAAGLALAAAALASAASADQIADVKASGKLVCGTMGTLEPFSFKDNATREIVGYDVDLCRFVADSLGVELELKLIAVEARIPELTQGRVDIISAALGYTAERAQQIDYSDTAFVSRQMLMVKSGSGIEKLEDLDGKKISAPKGSSSERFTARCCPTPTSSPSRTRPPPSSRFSSRRSRRWRSPKSRSSSS